MWGRHSNPALHELETMLYGNTGEEESIKQVVTAAETEIWHQL
jgi:hypothetical protein